MKVDVIWPKYRVIEPECDWSVQSMLDYSASQGVDLHVPRIKGHTLIHRVRNGALNRVRPDTDYVLWCDDDMVPQKDSLLRLLEHKEDIVSAVCTTRDDWPVKIVAKAWRRDTDQFVIIPDEEWEKLLGKVMKGPFGVGFGFVLTSRKVIDDAIEWHLSARDWLALNRRMLDRLKVRKEYREAERKRISSERRNWYEQKHLLRVFDLTIQENELERGEDIHFSRMALEMGYHITLDTNVWVFHMGKLPYGPQLCGIKHWSELRMKHDDGANRVTG